MTGNPVAAGDARRTRAHVLPFAVFMGFLLVLQVISGFIAWDHPAAPWWRKDPAHFIYPLQCAAAVVLLARYWRHYDFRWSWTWSLAGVAAGLLGIGLWLLPTMAYDWLGLTENPGGWLERLGVSARADGYDPGDFSSAGGWWFAVAARFFRAVVVVALVEEIFWRGFLMRFVENWEGDYWNEPFGKPSWRNFLIVTGAFVAAHAPADYAGALVYGSLTWLLCIWSKNLGACIIMHAIANLAMCLYIMATGKYGLW